MRDGPTQRQALENLWRERLNDAKLRLDFARNFVKELQRDHLAGGVPPPDGEFAFRKALTAENRALAEYNRVLHIFSDLVVRRQLPNESRTDE